MLPDHPLLKKCGDILVTWKRAKGNHDNGNFSSIKALPSVSRLLSVGMAEEDRQLVMADKMGG